jgi:predicted nuclease of predicted toxin-antitoxin system
MKLKTDENLPVEVAEALQAAGHDAATVHGQRLTGRPDLDVAAACRGEGRVLVTLDTDFANVQRYPPSEYPGLIVLRLAHQDKPYVLSQMPVVIALLQHEPIHGRLWIVEEARVRIRE